MNHIERSVAAAPIVVDAAKSLRRPWYTLALLMSVGVINMTDRQILSIFIVPIQAEFKVDDASMGFLTGFGFSLFYVLAGLPIARWLDTGNRRNILALCIAGWSIATGLCGLATSYMSLLLTRIGVAVGEAAANPGVISIASDMYPPQQRARVVSIYYVGNSLGVFIGLAVGGWLAATVGWRYAFVLIGIPGLLLALAIRFTIDEPVRGLFDTEVISVAPSLKQTLMRLFQLRTYQLLIVASIFYSSVLYGQMAWAATFLIRVHGMTSSEVGLKLGIVSGIGLVVGNLLGGIVADFAAKASIRWYLLVPAIANIASIPFIGWFFFTDSQTSALIAYVPMICLLGSSTAAMVAAVMSVCHPQMRATGYSAYYLSAVVIGMGSGPFLIGVLSDALTAEYGANAIRYAIFAVTIVGLLIAIAAMIAGSRTIVRDSQRANADFVRISAFSPAVDSALNK